MSVSALDEVQRVLVVVAHPDDAEFWAGGTIALWSASGVDVSYLVLTDGGAGGVDAATNRDEIPKIRRSEQRRSASILGVTNVNFLGEHEGELHQSTPLRREIVRMIRQVRPERVVTWSPEWNWEQFRSSCHVDHRATGELVLTAIFPDAGNLFAHPDLARTGLEPWTATDIWLLNSPQPNHYVDITDYFDRKVAAVESHVSQVGHRGSMTASLRERIATNTATAGLPDGRLAEAFQVVANR
ncbi:MAG: PIG-L deacetylase family protein [Pseudonocardiaceae bacterium]